MPAKADLPAGFSITSIDGRRCTKVPRSLTTIAGETSFATTTTTAKGTTTTTSQAPPPPPPSSTSSSSPPPLPEITTSSAQDLATSSVTEPPVTSTTAIAAAAVAASTLETTPSITSTSTSAPIAIPAATSAAPVEPAAASSSASASAVPASKGTTPTTSSSTVLPLPPQSELSSTPTPTGISNNDGLRPVAISKTSTFISITVTASAGPEDSSATASVSSNTKQAVAPIMGGVVGGIALVGVISLILLCLRRRRSRRTSLLTPLTSSTQEQFYEIDRGSVGPTKRTVIWRANLGGQTDRIRNAASDLKSRFVGAGASLKSKVVHGSNSGSVNLNRGNSQFLDGPIPQHSRNNSSLLSGQAGELTTKDRFADWWERFTENAKFNWRLRSKERDPVDPFATMRGMAEKPANAAAPDFSQLLGMDDRGLQLQADRRRASLRSSFSGFGGLGLDFETLDPFADPIAQPENSVRKQQTYVTDIRRSRGLSMENTNEKGISTYRHPSIGGPTAQYPPSIAPSRDSYRDTVFSTFSTNVRKGKGRSDPFDLERPDLWLPQNPPLPTAARDSSYPDPLRMSSARVGPQPRLVSTQPQRIESISQSYTSKYSSGISSLGDWGDPGPDLGPGSENASLRRNTSGGVSLGSFEQIERGWDERRQTDNVSPLSVESKASTRGGVGKAM